MAICNDIKLLRSDLREAFLKMKQEALELYGITIIAFETIRSEAVQQAYYMQGRKPLAEVNTARINAGLHTITEEENKRKITNSNKSIYHGTGRAVDIVIVRYEGKRQILVWNAPFEAWKKIADIGIKYGLTWGGQFQDVNGKPLKDYGHYQVE